MFCLSVVAADAVVAAAAAASSDSHRGSDARAIDLLDSKKTEVNQGWQTVLVESLQKRKNLAAACESHAFEASFLPHFSQQCSTDDLFDREDRFVCFRLLLLNSGRRWGGSDCLLLTARFSLVLVSRTQRNQWKRDRTIFNRFSWYYRYYIILLNIIWLAPQYKYMSIQ